MKPSNGIKNQLIDFRVLQDFITNRQLNNDEMVIYAKHQTMLSDMIDSELQWNKVLTIDKSGVIWQYIRETTDGHVDCKYNRIMH